MTSHPGQFAESTPIPVSIISGSLLLRDGLISLLKQHISIHLVGSYEGAFEPTIARPNPAGHIALLDSSIGLDNALAWTRWWQRLEPPTAVLIVELDNDKDTIIRCIEAGAVGYTLRGASAEQVAYTIRCAKEGTATCSAEMVAHLFARLAAVNNAPPTSRIPLTSRELEVLDCVAKGYSNKEIAAALVIELYTVKNHIHHILEKLNLNHRLDAARYAINSGWLKAPHRPYIVGQ